MRVLMMISLFWMAMAAPAYALDLAAARAQSLVCEKPDGTIAASGGAGAEVKALVESVNQGRKAEYARIGASKGQPASVVGQLTAKELVGKGYAACK